MASLIPILLGILKPVLEQLTGLFFKRFSGPEFSGVVQGRAKLDSLYVHDDSRDADDDLLRRGGASGLRV